MPKMSGPVMHQRSGDSNAWTCVVPQRIAASAGKPTEAKTNLLGGVHVPSCALSDYYSFQGLLHCEIAEGIENILTCT